MTFVKTKIELSKLSEGDILEVLLAEGEPLENVPRNARLWQILIYSAV